MQQNNAPGATSRLSCTIEPTSMPVSPRTSRRWSRSSRSSRRACSSTVLLGVLGRVGRQAIGGRYGSRRRSGRYGGHTARNGGGLRRDCTGGLRSSLPGLEPRLRGDQIGSVREGTRGARGRRGGARGRVLRVRDVGGIDAVLL